jgi:hypothetical protein
MLDNCFFCYKNRLFSILYYLLYVNIFCDGTTLAQNALVTWTRERCNNAFEYITPTALFTIRLNTYDNRVRTTASLANDNTR